MNWLDTFLKKNLLFLPKYNFKVSVAKPVNIPK